MLQWVETESESEKGTVESAGRAALSRGQRSLPTHETTGTTDTSRITHQGVFRSRAVEMMRRQRRMSWGCGGAGVMGREAALLRALMEGPGNELGTHCTAAPSSPMKVLTGAFYFY